MVVGRRPTVQDVARRAGVSPSLVSRVLRGQMGFASTETRRAIERAAQELAYQPNTLARHLRTGQTAVVGVLFYRLVSYHVYLPVVSGIEEVLRLTGYTMLLSSADSPDGEAAALRLFRSHQVAGVVLVSNLYRMPSAHLSAAAQDGLPLVAINRWLDEDGDRLTGASGPVPRVLWDYAGGARALASRLLALGHRRLAIVSDQPFPACADRVSHQQRWHAIRETARAAGAPPPAEYLLDDVAGDRWREDGITAFLAINDRTAANVLHALAAQGVALPQDVSLTGFTDTEVASHLTPRLTTARLPFEESGRIAARLLLDLVRGDAVAPVTLV
ncbi:MAG: LacI family DNA-binding transcriptional regulator, partial [Chloroflexota bacterium]